MDRFIASKLTAFIPVPNLKSNMDRFIGYSFANGAINRQFKIQYGQIYRVEL